MPTYSFRCSSETCNTIIEDEASIKTYAEHHPLCPTCGSQCNYVWVPYPVHSVLKDGPSGSWPSKGERFKKYRAKQAEIVSRRQKERYGHLHKGVVPNYGGKETGSWREAQIEALKDRGADSAATYNAKVQEELADNTKIKV